ncbi:hypothetical protein BDR04DRAFT_1086839 [Suillus decipiens]|nr:hypothetical protein BDR04DRAFT_1086839 [Suillus decipiens]
MNGLAEITPDPDMLMFGDEVAKNKHTLDQQMGYSARGTRYVQSRPFVRGTRWSILPILTLDGIITHDNGSVTSKRFVEFLRELVVCEICRIIDTNCILLTSRERHRFDRKGKTQGFDTG